MTFQSFGFCRLRHRSTCVRIWLILLFRSYCCCSVSMPCCCVMSSARCGALVLFLGFGIGVMNDAGRLPGFIWCVGWRFWSSCQCCWGGWYGEFMMGFSKNSLFILGFRLGVGLLIVWVICWCRCCFCVVAG